MVKKFDVQIVHWLEQFGEHVELICLSELLIPVMHYYFYVMHGLVWLLWEKKNDQNKGLWLTHVLFL